MDEIAATTPSFAGVNYEMLETVGRFNGRATKNSLMVRRLCTLTGSGEARASSLSPNMSPRRKRPDRACRFSSPRGGSLSQYNVGAQTGRTENSVWHEEDLLEIHQHDAEVRGICDDQYVRLASRAGETQLKAQITDRVSTGVVYTTFHHPDTQANVITTDYSDRATNCPEYKVTAVQVALSNGPSAWQEDYNAQAANSRRILPTAE